MISLRGLMQASNQKTLSGFRAFLFERLANPMTRDSDPDCAGTISLHQKIISKNPILQYLYRKHYERFQPSIGATSALNLPMVEIGAGPSHIEKYIPGVIKTDVVAHANVDLVARGEELPFSDEGIRCLFLVNSFHHLQFPDRLLKEADRCLAPGGRLVCVEPYNSPPAKFIGSFSPYEYFDDSVSTWNNRDNLRLRQANNSIPWIVFVRDRKEFERRFPRLKILTIEYHTLIAFYLSGGFNYRSFFSGRLLPLIRVIEWMGRPICRWLGCQMTVVLEKH